MIFPLLDSFKFTTRLLIEFFQVLIQKLVWKFPIAFKLAFQKTSKRQQLWKFPKCFYGNLIKAFRVKIEAFKEFLRTIHLGLCKIQICSQFIQTIHFFTVLRRFLKASADYSTQVFQGFIEISQKDSMEVFRFLKYLYKFLRKLLRKLSFACKILLLFKKLSLFTITTVSMKVLLGSFRSLGKTFLKLSSNFYKSLKSIIVSFEEIFRT